jgi:hypothetical protein
MQALLDYEPQGDYIFGMRIKFGLAILAATSCVLLLTGCGSSSNKTSTSSSGSSKSSATDIQSQLDAACKIFNDAMLVHPNYHDYSLPLFTQAASAFRQLIIAYPPADNYFKGSMWAVNDENSIIKQNWSLITPHDMALAAAEHYGDPKSASAFVDTQNYCASVGTTSTNGHD